MRLKIGGNLPPPELERETYLGSCSGLRVQLRTRNHMKGKHAHVLTVENIWLCMHVLLLLYGVISITLMVYYNFGATD